MHVFTVMRYLDLSNNSITDASPLECLVTLRELDVSGNRIASISFCEKMESLETLHAASNRIRTLSTRLPSAITELDLAGNELQNLDFMEKLLPFGLEKIDLSDNQIEKLIDLRFISLFQRLHTMRVGLLQKCQGYRVLDFIKHLCPRLEYFDDTSCLNVQEPEFDDDQLIDILVNVSEPNLRTFLSSKTNTGIIWNEPSFVEFNDDAVAATPIRDLQNRIRRIEASLVDHPPVRPTPVIGTLLPISPYAHGDDGEAEMRALREEIGGLKDQIEKAVELLFVHDSALRHLWGQANGGNG
jgi:hypothetical protein